MNKTLLIGGLVIVAGAGTYFIFSGAKNQPASSLLPQGARQEQNRDQNQSNGQDQSQTAVNPSGEYTINELLTMSRPMKCTWKQSLNEGAEVTNIIYVNGKKFYQDVTMGDVGHAYTISDGDYLYIWNDFTGVASKMKYSEMEAASQPGEGKPSAADINQKHDFLCEKWAADNSKFIPPSDKQFNDVTEEMNEAMGDLQQNSEKYEQQACDMCRKAPSPELVDQCLKSMQCE